MTNARTDAWTDGRTQVHAGQEIKIQSNNVPHLNLYILVWLFTLRKILCDGEENKTYLMQWTQFYSLIK